MWHQARKQEKKIRVMMVDYKKRAERRREYYEKIKADPTQFLQIHGRQCKIHLDPAVAQAAETPNTMMPWQGNHDTLIDRFDVRAHLDYIPDYKPPEEADRIIVDDSWEERHASYERYRTLVQNDFLTVPEEKFLYQIFLEEQFGPISNKSIEEEKKKLADKKVAIGYVYEDSTPQTSTAQQPEEEEKKDDDSDIDLDVTVDVDELTIEQSREMNEQAVKYGMVGDDFITLLHKDKEEAEALRLAKEAEEEKAMYSGRKSRRERRAFREKKLQGRKISPPSYAARESPTYDPYRRSTSPSRSRSRSPVNCGEITYITSFGGEGSEESEGDKSGKRKKGQLATSSGVVGPSFPPQSQSAVQIVTASSSSSTHGAHSDSVTKKRYDARKSSRSRSRSRSPTYRRRERTKRRRYSYSRSRSRSRSRTRSRRRRSRSYSSSRSRSSSRRRSSSRSRSLSHSRSRSYSRSRSRSRSPQRARGRSRSKSRSSRSSRSKSRSRSSSTSARKLVGKTKSGSKTPPQQSQSVPAVPIPRYSYYQRLKQNKSSSSEQSDDSDGDQRSDSAKTSGSTRSLTSLGKPGLGSKRLTPQEKLKRKMQAALNRQFKADKKAEQKKIEKLEQERQDREEELREMAIKLRRRERERRHRMLESERGGRRGDDYDDDDSGSNSRSRSRSPAGSRSPSESPTRSPESSHSDRDDDDSPRRKSRWDRKRRSRSSSRSPVRY